MTRTGRVPHLMTHVAAPALALHPRDATARGIIDRGLARIESAEGSVVMRVSLDDGVRPGDVFAPMHWTDQFASTGPIDRLVHAITDPVSGQPDLKGTRVRVSAVAEAWRGNLFRLAGGNPEFSDSVWWAKAQTGAGFGFELSGFSPLAKEIHSESVLRRLLHISAEAELVSYSDARKGTFRYAGIVKGRLGACAFFGPPGSDFPGLEQAKGLLGKEISAMDRIALLAGLDSSGGKTAGKTVCSCFSVSEDAICAAIRDDGLKSPAEIGNALKAGTNCGSCIPEIKKLIASQLLSSVS
jgi:assimilatory nitrate reductase catalytic subunit